MNLKELRFRKGLNQFDIQLLSGVHQSRISLIERGYVKPTSKELERLARALKVKPEDLEFKRRRVE